MEKMLQEGTIRSILCPYATPVFLTRKNNGPPDSPEAYRFANDYRKLNAITKYPRYPLPVMDDLITNIPHTGIMPTLDLKSGYFFQFAISPKDVKKTAFITRNGTFAFLRMPFGLSEAAPNFQNAIDIISKPVIRRFVMVYMDDVIITSPSFNEHIDHLNNIFALLRDAGLTLNKDICHFARDKLKYLGLRISKGGIETPTIEQFNLFTDTSGVGIGAVLNQKHRPIAFASRTLNEAERSYTVTERECLAVIWVLNMFKTYFGSLPVKVITDHVALTKLTNGKNLSSRMVRWVLKLSEFNIEWEHRIGVQNVVADALSRNPVGNMDGSQISCAALRALALNSRKQLIQKQREDLELGHIFRYLENPDDGSVIATVLGAEYVAGNIEILFDDTRQNMRKQHKTWEKCYNRKRREVNIKVNDLVLVQTHFVSAAGRRVVGKFMPKFDGPYRVLEVRNNNLIIWKKGKRVTVNINQRSSNGSSRSHTGKYKISRKTSSEESKDRKSNKGNAGLEDPTLKHKVRSNGSVERTDKKRSKICRKTSLQGFEHGDQKRPTPVPTHGIKRTVPSSISSRNHKYRRPNNSSQGPQSISGPSQQLDTRQCKRPTEKSRQGARGQYDRARETRTIPSKGNSAAERRPVRSRQAIAVRPCPYYLWSRLKKPEGMPEEQRSNGIDSLPQNNLRRRSLSMEALDGNPVDRSE
ncbi:retrovirus-related Pol polyprotein from transposon 297 [Trichonephila clavipes]|nr:retrovirus-related Pol polyprotein from transposon 297 [Trichonephila clavipes]